MKRIRLQRLRWALLVLGMLLPGVVAFQVQAAPSTTVAACDITPRTGGPGTVVHADLFQWSDTKPVAVGFAVPKTPAELQGRSFVADDPELLKPLDKPLAVMPAPINGPAETTFKIPARLSSGQPVPQANLYLVCIVNGKVDMGAGWGSLAFSFIPGNLPATGHAPVGLWLTLILSALVFLIAGIQLSRQGAYDAAADADAPDRRGRWWANHRQL